MNSAPTTPLDAVFSALADPTRRAILTMLLEDDMAVTDVAEPFRMSLAAISKHLQVLADAGLISQEKRGRVKWCRLEPYAMSGAVTWIQSFGQLDPMDFDAFERFLERELTDGADAPDSKMPGTQAPGASASADSDAKNGDAKNGDQAAG